MKKRDQYFESSDLFSHYWEKETIRYDQKPNKDLEIYNFRTRLEEFQPYFIKNDKAFLPHKQVSASLRYDLEEYLDRDIENIAEFYLEAFINDKPNAIANLISISTNPQHQEQLRKLIIGNLCFVDNSSREQIKYYRALHLVTGKEEFVKHLKEAMDVINKFKNEQIDTKEDLI